MTLRALFIDLLAMDSENPTPAVASWIASLSSYVAEVQLCLGPEQTRSSIKLAVQTFAKEVRAGDDVLIHYAGHGGVLEFLDGGEGLPPDWHLQPWGCIGPDALDPKKVGAEVYYISELLADLQANVLGRPNTITLVFDCCFAGAMFRPKHRGAIAVPPAILELASRGFDRNSGNFDDVVCVHAAGNASRAYADRVRGAKMTMALAAAFEQHGSRRDRVRVSWASILATVRHALRDEPGVQDPIVLGDRGRIPFTRETLDISTRMDCIVDARGQAIVICGALQGLATNDRIRVVDRNGSTYDAHVTRAGFHRAALQFDELPAPSGSHDAMLLACADRQGVAVTGIDDGRAESLRRLVARTPELELSNVGTFEVAVEAEHLRLSTPSGAARVFVRLDELVASMVGLVRAARLLALARSFEDQRPPVVLGVASMSGEPRVLGHGVPVNEPSLDLDLVRNPELLKDSPNSLHDRYRVAVLELEPDGGLRVLEPSLEFPGRARRAYLMRWRPMTGRLVVVASSERIDPALLGKPEVRFAVPSTLDIEDGYLHVSTLDVAAAVAVAVATVPAKPLEQSRVHRELLHRAQESRRKLEEWLHEDDFIPSSRLDNAQASALISLFKRTTANVEQLEHALTDAPDPNKRKAAGKQLEGSVVALGHTRALVRLIVDQRRDPTLVAGLQLADVCTLDSWATLGCSKTPPIAVAEANVSPAMTPRSAAVRAPGLINRPVQQAVGIPFIYVPPTYLHAAWMMTTLQHELGHCVDDRLQLSSDAWVAILEQEVTTPVENWKRWFAEIVADLWGVVLGGEGFVCTLASLLSTYVAPKWLVESDYPPLALRVEILRLLLAELEIGSREIFAELDQIAAERPLEFATYQRDARKLISALLDAEVNTRPVRAIVECKRDAETTLELSSLLRDTCDLDGALPEHGCARLVPSAAQLASRAEPDKLQHIHDRALDAVRLMTKEDWLLDDAQVEFTAEVERLRASKVDKRTGKTIKELPILKIATSDRLAFVGLNNYRLVKGLKDAFAERNKLGRGHWDSVEVFFLHEHYLAWFVDGKRNLAQLACERSQAIDELRAWFSSESPTRSWTLYEYARPHLFASFFDWEENHGMIHTSSHIWGAHVSTTPGLDLRRGSRPSERYAAFVEGLGQLRSLDDTTRL